MRRSCTRWTGVAARLRSVASSPGLFPQCFARSCCRQAYFVCKHRRRCAYKIRPLEAKSSVLLARPIVTRCYRSQLLLIPRIARRRLQVHASPQATTVAMEKQGLLPTEPPPSYEDVARVPSPHSKTPAGTTGARRPPPGPPPPLDLPSLNALRKERVVLASASPRRRQLLAQVRTRTSYPRSDANDA